MPLMIMLVLLAIMSIILYHTRTGVNIYAIGKNRRIAATMGVNTRATSIKTYVLCGLCAGLTGLLLACLAHLDEA